MWQRTRDRPDLADEVLRQCRQQFRPVGDHHVVVDRRNRCRQADLEFHAGGNDAGLLQTVEHCKRLDRHVGIASLERRRVGRRSGFDPQLRNLAHKLAVPLHEPKRRHVGARTRSPDARRAHPAGSGSRSCGFRSRHPEFGRDEARPHPKASGTRSPNPAAECCRRNARSDACCDPRSWRTSRSLFVGCDMVARMLGHEPSQGVGDRPGIARWHRRPPNANLLAGIEIA